MDSFAERSPFVVPADGMNLNRAFPGDPDGSYTDRLAHDRDAGDTLGEVHMLQTIEAPADGVILFLPRARP